MVFEKFSIVGLSLNKKKCNSTKTLKHFLVLYFQTKASHLIQKRFKQINDAKSPTLTHGVRSFLGMVMYCSGIFNFY